MPVMPIVIHTITLACRVQNVNIDNCSPLQDQNTSKYLVSMTTAAVCMFNVNCNQWNE